MASEAKTPGPSVKKETEEQSSPSSVLDFGVKSSVSWQGPFKVTTDKLRQILEKAFGHSVNIPDLALEAIGHAAEMDPVLILKFKLNRINAKKPAGMTTEAAVAAVLAGLNEYADRVTPFPDKHQTTHQLVAYFEDPSRVYEAKRGMQQGGLGWAFSPSVLAMRQLGHEGDPEEPVATDVLITIKNARKSEGDAGRVDFFYS